MNSNAREMSDVLPGKEEDEKGMILSSSNPPSSSSSLLSSWSRLKDPRIVRVSRAFGGKDRHSKVCTVRGLRDRRVRLSVPTAIQLYDLQDRLGLNQPSKVVDWLLNVAKNEIDELPPLQMPVGGMGGVGGGNLIDENFRSMLGSHLGKEVESNVSNHPWISDTLLRNNDKEVEGQGLSLMNHASSSSEQQFMTWDSSSSSLSLAQSGNSAMCSNTHDHHHNHNHHHLHQGMNFNVLPLMTSASHQQQVLVYQPQHSYFAAATTTTATTAEEEEEEGNQDYVPKQFSFHMLDSSSDNINRFSNPQDRQF